MGKIKDHYNIVALGRVSSEAQDKDSNQSQLQKVAKTYLKAVPEGRIYKNVAQVQSGRLDDRSQLTDLYESLKRYNRHAVNPVTLILLLRWDRWFRNLVSAMHWIKQFKEIGVEVNTVERWIDFSDAMSMTILCVELAHAQQVSDDIAAHVRRCYTHKVQTGTYPVARVPGIFKRVWNDTRTSYDIIPTKRFNAMKAAVYLVMAGSGQKQAWLSQGGRDVLGSEDAFTQLLRNPILKAKYRNVRVNVPQLLEDDEFSALQRELDRRKPLSKSERRRSEFYLKPTLICPNCGKPLTSDPAKSGKHPYYTCFSTSPRHYRLPAGEVHQAWTEAMEQLTLSARATQRLSKKAVERSERQKETAAKEVKTLQAKMNNYKAVVEGATEKYVLDHISYEQFENINEKYRKLEMDLKAANQILENHGLILSHVLQSLQHISLAFKEHPNKALMSHFVRMAFPSGLVYDRKNRYFRTDAINAALGLINLESAGSIKIKTRLPSTKDNNRVRSGLRGYVRTPASDIVSFWAYCKAAKLVS